MRWLANPAYLALGVTCAGLGALGLVLPLLPTTPFLLLAAWCFDRSSPRLHAALLRMPGLGPLLSSWRDHGAIGLEAKITCTALLAACGAIAVVRGTPAWALVAMSLVSAGALMFVWTRPSGPRATTAVDERDGAT